MRTCQSSDDRGRAGLHRIHCHRRPGGAQIDLTGEWAVRLHEDSCMATTCCPAGLAVGDTRGFPYNEPPPEGRQLGRVDSERARANRRFPAHQSPAAPRACAFRKS